MPDCKKIQKKKQKICIGDMRDSVILQDRAIQPPDFDDVDFTEDFNVIAETWGMVKTVSGRTYFDGVNTETPITHEIFIRYDSSITAETWVEFDSRRFDILNVDILDERKEFIKLQCNDRGFITQDATQAGFP